MSIWRTKQGWRGRIMVKGKNVYAPVTFRYKAQAKKWCAEERGRQRSSPDTLTGSLWELMQLYLADSEMRHHPRTHLGKVRALSLLYEHVGDVDPREVTPEQVSTLLYARAREVSPSAYNKMRKDLRAFYRWASKVHGTLHDPTAAIEPLPHQKKARHLIQPQDVFKVMMAARFPERALIGSYWYTAARRGEVLRWAWAEDINFSKRWVRLGTRKKTGVLVHDRLPMGDDLHDLLMTVWRKRDPASPYVFPDYYFPGGNNRGEQRAHQLLKRLCDQAEVPRFGYHDIRHAVATYLNDVQMVGLKTVQRWLRHRNQTTTEIYVEGSYTDLADSCELLNLTQDLTQRIKKGASE